MKLGYLSIGSSLRPTLYTIVLIIGCFLFFIRCNDVISNNTDTYDETIRYSEEGNVEIIKGENLSLSLDSNSQFRELKTEKRYGDIAYAFLESRKDILKIQDPIDEFQIISENVDNLGLKHIKFQQVYMEVPIWGKEVTIHLDKQNNVYLFQGKSVATVQKFNTEPRISERQATEYAKQDASKEKTGWGAKEVKLYIYMLKKSVPRLSYKISLSKGITDKKHYFVDATNGDILHIITGIQH